MTWTDRLGYAKFLFNVGKEYGDLVRGTVTGGAALTFVANYFGLSKVASIAVGAALVPVTLAVAIGAGYVVVRWRVIHATIEREWENNPYMRAQIDALHAIRDAVRVPPIAAARSGLVRLEQPANGPGRWVHGQWHDARMAADHEEG